MFPRAPRLVSFPCFSTAPSRFLSSFPRKLRGNQLVWAQNQPKRQIPGYTWKLPCDRLGILPISSVSPQILPQTSSQTQGNSRVARMEHQTPSSFPGNFRKRKVLGTLSFPFWFPETWIQAKARAVECTELSASEGPRTGGPGRRHDRPPRVRGRPGKWPKSDEFSKCEQLLRGVNSSQAGCGAVALQRKFCVLGH